MHLGMILVHQIVTEDVWMVGTCDEDALHRLGFNLSEKRWPGLLDDQRVRTPGR